MFRLLPRGLPKDPEYPTDLKQLGYFVNDDDEIRSIENPKYYFKYFINRTERYNERQRESMNSLSPHHSPIITTSSHPK
ncbi:hypothetical protein V501_10164 [Pseudogymnoascus sp. VKM F-4519 (FW-2642)]|nr:hypothetical protein V501_10164 [Pseudogymnoascus sp. VKM F-4519 (FW-2642)]